MKWKNIDSDTSTFFITATITEWYPLLRQPAARQIFLDDLKFYLHKYQASLLAYVVMPEHYHLVVQLQRSQDLHSWLRDFQSHTAHQLAEFVKAEQMMSVLQLFAAHSNGTAKLAVWKEQARVEGVLSEKVLNEKMDYIHQNPVRRGLVQNAEEWLYSSFRNHYCDDHSIIDMRVFQ